MTLNDIIVAALAQLDRGHDAQTLDVWRDKLTRFANDGIADLAGAIKPRRTQAVLLDGGAIDLAQLTRACMKIVRIAREEKELAFMDGDTAGRILVPGVADGPIQITYRFLPRELTAATDVPELPAPCHALIVTYVVGRERASGDVSVQRGANIYFQMYEAGKRLLLPRMGGPEEHRLVNRW